VKGGSIGFFVLIVLTLTGLACPVCAGAGANSQNRGWVVKQKGNYLGKQTFYVSPGGIKITSSTISVLATGEQATAFIYNNETQKFLEMPYEEGLTAFVGRKSITPKSSHVTKGKKGVIAGLKATQYIMEDVHEHGRKVTGEFWIADEELIPAKWAKSLSAWSGLPRGFGFPLRIYMVRKGGKKALILDTISAEKADIPDSAYKIPKGYTKAEDEMTVIFGGDLGEDIDLSKLSF
jgi:hypothetical protein